MPLVVKSEGLVADLVRLIFYLIVALYLSSMLLPFYNIDDGSTFRGWRVVKTTLSVPLLFPSNFGFFVAVFLVGGGRFLGGAIISALATCSMFAALFIAPGGGSNAWSGSFGLGLYCWIASGVMLTLLAALLYLTQNFGVNDEP